VIAGLAEQIDHLAVDPDRAVRAAALSLRGQF
jgi:hypothetical protein